MLSFHVQLPPAIVHSLSSSEIKITVAARPPCAPFPDQRFLTCMQWYSYIHRYTYTGARAFLHVVFIIWSMVFPVWKLKTFFRIHLEMGRGCNVQSSMLLGVEKVETGNSLHPAPQTFLSLLLQDPKSSPRLRSLSRLHCFGKGGNCHNVPSVFLHKSVEVCLKWCNRNFRQAKG